MTPRAMYLCGPTASGKSALAIELAGQFDGEIVNADAFQLYRGLEILSAAPTPEDREKVPHHLYGVIPAVESCDAQRYCELARPVIAEIISRGKTPIVTGGSGLYLKFLTHGPSPLPRGDAQIRSQLDALSLDELNAQLREVDPVEAARINPQNRRYVSRALEICLLTGAPSSQQRDEWRHVAESAVHSLRGLVLQMPRDILHQRIAARSAAIMASGAIQEVAKLDETCSHTILKAIGIEQIRALRAGDSDEKTCLQKIIEATRQYAKRQETWFRRESWLTPAPALDHRACAEAFGGMIQE